MMETKIRKSMTINSGLWKLLRVQCIWLLFVPMIFAACDESQGDNPVLLSFVETSIPTGELPADGGSVVLEVDWSKTKWNVSADDVVEGSEFIIQITPAYAGSETQGRTKTNVKITYGPKRSRSVRRPK
jgi:hypothetical protein